MYEQTSKHTHLLSLLNQRPTLTTWPTPPFLSPWSVRVRSFRHGYERVFLFVCLVFRARPSALVFRDVRSSALRVVGMWVFICFDTDLPLWPSGLKHEPTEQSLRQYTAITGASLPKDSPVTTSVWPSKHKHSWFKHWYRLMKRWMNYILHLPFRHVAGNLTHSDICFEFLLVITGRRKAIMFLCFLL